MPGVGVCGLVAVTIAVSVVAVAGQHSEPHIDDAPHAVDIEEDPEREEHAAFEHENHHLDVHHCEICRQLMVPVLYQAVQASGNDADAKAVVLEALEPLSRSHRYDPEGKAVVENEQLSEEDDEYVHEHIQEKLWDDFEAASLYAIVDLWHNYSPERRTHLKLLMEHALCTCPDDRMLHEPNARLHEYLKEYESAVHSALHKYGGHPDNDPVLSAHRDYHEALTNIDEELPEVHHELRGDRDYDVPDTLQPHDHAPPIDGHDIHGDHAHMNMNPTIDDL